MKKLLTLLIAITAVSALSAEDKVTFDIWNKNLTPLYFELSNLPPTGKNLVKLNAFGEDDSNIQQRLVRAFKYVGTETGFKIIGFKAIGLNVRGDYAQSSLWDTTTPTYILLTNRDKLYKGDKATLLTIKPGKDIFIRIKPDDNGKQIFPNDTKKYLVGPQTGPLFGWLGRTERWLPLADNITKDDIKIDTNYVIGGGVAAKPVAKPVATKPVAKPSAKEPSEAVEEKSEITPVTLDISDTPNVLDDILANFNSEGDYIGFGEFTQDDADVYEDALSSGKAGMDAGSISYYEAWLDPIKKAIGNKGISKETKKLHDTLADVLKDDEVTTDEQAEVADVYKETKLTGDQATIGDFKSTLDQIISGFNDDGDYIGYTDMEGNFANIPFEERHLRNFDNNILLLKAGDPTATDDIEFYEGWRDFLLDAIGKMPQGQKAQSPDQGVVKTQ